jgi:hypothetical protein
LWIESIPDLLSKWNWFSKISEENLMRPTPKRKALLEKKQEMKRILPGSQNGIEPRNYYGNTVNGWWKSDIDWSPNGRRDGMLWMRNIGRTMVRTSSSLDQECYRAAERKNDPPIASKGTRIWQLPEQRYVERIPSGDNWMRTGFVRKTS